MPITLGAILPKVLRIRANRRVSFFIPAVLDNQSKSVTLEPGSNINPEFVDLTEFEVIELGTQLTDMVDAGFVTVTSIDEPVSAENVSYAPDDPGFFGGATELPLKEALDDIVAGIGGGGGVPPVTTETSNYVIPTSMFTGTVFMDTTSGPLTATLPDASGNAGQYVRVKNIGSADDVTVNSAGGTVEFNTIGPSQSWLYQSDGSNWYIT